MEPSLLFISDLDRTVLTHNHVLPNKVVKAFARAKAAGMRILLATARSPVGVAPFVEALGITEPCICFNGAWIGDVVRRTALQSSRLNRALANRAMELARDLNLSALWYTEDAVYSTDRNEVVIRETDITGDRLHIVERFADIESEPHKIMCVARTPKEQAHFSTVSESLAGSLLASRSHARLLELSPIGTGKATAAKYLCDRFAINLKCLAAAGDAENDLQLLRCAGIPLTVSNAIVELQNMARFVGASCDEGGLAEVIDWLLLNNAAQKKSTGVCHA